MTNDSRFALFAVLTYLIIASPLVVRSQDDGRSKTGRDEFSGKSITDKSMAHRLMEKRIMNAPLVAEQSPEILLKSLDGKSVWRADMQRDRPLVVIASSWSCDIFRESLGGLQDLYASFGESADFALVYIREAHPDGGFAGALGRGPDPLTENSRIEVATRCKKQLRIKFPVYVDSMDDAFATLWGAWPLRIFVIELNGVISFSGMQGPWGYRPYVGFEHGDGYRDKFDLRHSQETLEEFLIKRRPMQN